jgi:hypothetical protein
MFQNWPIGYLFNGGAKWSLYSYGAGTPAFRPEIARAGESRRDGGKACVG